MVLGGYLLISKDSVKDPEILGFIKKRKKP